jgi:hypothetical protein
MKRQNHNKTREIVKTTNTTVKTHKTEIDRLDYFLTKIWNEAESETSILKRDELIKSALRLQDRRLTLLKKQSKKGKLYLAFEKSVKTLEKNDDNLALIELGFTIAREIDDEAALPIIKNSNAIAIRQKTLTSILDKLLLTPAIKKKIKTEMGSIDDIDETGKVISEIKDIKKQIKVI